MMAKNGKYFYDGFLHIDEANGEEFSEVYETLTDYLDDVGGEVEMELYYDTLTLRNEVVDLLHRWRNVVKDRNEFALANIRKDSEIEKLKRKIKELEERLGD